MVNDYYDVMMSILIMMMMMATRMMIVVMVEVYYTTDCGLKGLIRMTGYVRSLANRELTSYRLVGSKCR